MPMKIDSTTAKGQPTSTMRATGERMRETETDFGTELLEQKEALTADELDKLMQQIDEQGSRLSKTPTYEELRSYRDLVRQFIGEAVGSMYETHTQSGWDRLGRRKVYTVVRKIDNKLEEMTESIRLGQADQLSIIASHEAIRGLLVDLYM